MLTIEFTMSGMRQRLTVDQCNFVLRCRTCGGEFTTIDVDRLYCSEAHGRTYRTAKYYMRTALERPTVRTCH